MSAILQNYALHCQVISNVTTVSILNKYNTLSHYNVDIISASTSYLVGTNESMNILQTTGRHVPIHRTLP